MTKKTDAINISSALHVMVDDDTGLSDVVVSRSLIEFVNAVYYMDV